MSADLHENVHRLVVWKREFSKRGDTPRHSEIRSVGVAGAGMMGVAIAAAHLRHGIPVAIYDKDAKALDGVVGAVGLELERYPGETALDALIRFLRPAARLSDLAESDLVVETIVEDVSAKRVLLRELESKLGPEAILATNTSTIPISQLAGVLNNPLRLCGFHFCHPVSRRRLVEIVRSPKTDAAVVNAVVAHAWKIDRIPIVVQDGPGFVVNRLLFPYFGEALEWLREGVPIEAIERAATDFGMEMGPMRMMDEIGLDTVLRAAWVLAAEFPERIASSPLLVALVKAKRLGRKSGSGFFAYDSSEQAGEKIIVDRTVSDLLSRWIEPKSQPSQEELARGLILPMLVEATRIVADDWVGDFRDIDLAVLFGLGFPAEKGGLFGWADQLGAQNIVGMLRGLPHQNPRTEPTPMLLDRAVTGERFYDALADID